MDFPPQKDLVVEHGTVLPRERDELTTPEAVAGAVFARGRRGDTSSSSSAEPFGPVELPCVKWSSLVACLPYGLWELENGSLLFEPVGGIVCECGSKSSVLNRPFTAGGAGGTTFLAAKRASSSSSEENRGTGLGGTFSAVETI